MQAIETKYLPKDSGHQQPRIKAFGFQCTAIIDYEDDFTLECNHLNCAVQLLDNCGFSELSPYLITGQIYNSDYVHVINHEQSIKDNKR